MFCIRPPIDEIDRLEADLLARRRRRADHREGADPSAPSIGALKAQLIAIHGLKSIIRSPRAEMSTIASRLTAIHKLPLAENALNKIGSRKHTPRPLRWGLIAVEACMLLLCVAVGWLAASIS
jgi:hypothetical protein